MEARIRKEDLSAFKTQAADIVVKKDLLPVLSFIKIQVEGDFATLTKSNNRAFIVKSIPNDSEDCEFLVDETILNNFLEACDTDFVNFSIDGLRIVLTSGRARMISPTEHARMYPKIDLSSATWEPLPKLLTVTAGIASKIILDTELMMNAQAHVFAGNNFIAGSDFSIAYYQPIADKLPQLILRKEVAACVGKMAACQYSYNESYDLFKDGETLFGFVKSELGFFDMSGAFKMDDLKEPHFSTNKNAILRFTNLCINSATKGSSATLKASGNDIIHFELVDSGVNLDIHLDVPVANSDGNADFKFSPHLLTTLLKVIPCDDVYFYPGKQRYYITDLDKTFLAVIMLII